MLVKVDKVVWVTLSGVDVAKCLPNRLVLMVNIWVDMPAIQNPVDLEINVLICLWTQTIEQSRQLGKLTHADT